MCGIAGSANKDRAFNLYKLNLDRGYYSSGALILDSNNVYNIKKVLGTFNVPVDCFQPPAIHTEGRYYLYHSRGPTVETKGFIPENNHPFIYGDWIVAHNGIISNFEQLGREYFSTEDFTGKTDSCIIPRLLSIKENIADALELLKGTFAIWAYNTKENKTYLARSASTLFADSLTGDFSSTEFEGSISLNEGMVYTVADYNRIIPSGRFKHKSPYFIF